MYVIPRADVEAILTGSGFPPDEAPDPITARLLAAQLRGDEYLEGSLTKTPAGYRLDTRLVLTRDNTMVQPLPSAEAANVNDAARAVVASAPETTTPGEPGGGGGEPVEVRLGRPRLLDVEAREPHRFDRCARDLRGTPLRVGAPVRPVGSDAAAILAARAAAAGCFPRDSSAPS